MRSILGGTALVLAAIGLSSLGAPAEFAAAGAQPATAKSAARRPVPKQVLPWIEDDLTRAMAEARTRKLPVFVESWAPW